MVFCFESLARLRVIFVSPITPKFYLRDFSTFKMISAEALFNWHKVRKLQNFLQPLHFCFLCNCATKILKMTPIHFHSFFNCFLFAKFAPSFEEI